MARPIDEEKRHEIALAALAVLRERGVQGTRMSHVASAIGMNRSTLYWYFGNFSELFEYAVEHLREEETAHVAARVQQASHPIDVVWTALSGSYEFYAQRGIEDFVFLLCQGWVAGDAEQRERFTKTALKYWEPSRMLLIGVLTAGMASGQVRPCDPEAIVDLAIATLNGAMVGEVITGLPGAPMLRSFHELILEPLRCEDPS